VANWLGGRGKHSMARFTSCDNEGKSSLQYKTKIFSCCLSNEDMQSPQFSLMHRPGSALGLNKLALLSQPQFHTATAEESLPSDDFTAAFEAEMERLDRATDAIIAGSWDDDAKLPTTSKGDEEKTEPSWDDDDDDSINTVDDEATPQADESLTRELQLLDKLMYKDPNALSEQISKIIRQNKDDIAWNKDIDNEPGNTEEVGAIACTESHVPQSSENEDSVNAMACTESQTPQLSEKEDSETEVVGTTESAKEDLTPQESPATTPHDSSVDGVEEPSEKTVEAAETEVVGTMESAKEDVTPQESPATTSHDSSVDGVEQPSEKTVEAAETEVFGTMESAKEDVTPQESPATTSHDSSVDGVEETSEKTVEVSDVEKPEPSSTTSPVQEDVSEVEESVTTQSASQVVVSVPLESRVLSIDRSLFVGDTVQVIEADVNNNHSERIQFTGPIGSESRSVSTSKPLPRPQALTQQELEDVVTKNGSEGMVEPFVFPFVDMTGKVSSLPRLVSYYEIEITKNSSSLKKGKDEFGENSDDDYDGVTETVWDEPCVAVGLAGSNFPMKDTMPGWNRRSFGYHSDDGSAWGNRRKVTDYGHTFGIGDVVGCGLDYRIGAVFYTLNGKFLGLAFSLNDDELALDWYPTIGLDSHDFVACNFGHEKSFDFDLAQYCEDEPPAPLPSRNVVPSSPDKKIDNKVKRRRRFVSNGLRRLVSSLQLGKPNNRKSVKRLRQAVG